MVALLFVKNVVGCSGEVWLYSLAFAVFTVSFQLFYTKVLAIGCVSLTVMTVNLSMVIPTLVSFAFYNETMSILRVIGIVLTVAVIILVADSKSGGKINKKLLLFSLLSSLSNAAIGITQKIFNTSAFAVERGAFVSSSYILAFALTSIILLFSCILSKGAQKQEKTNYKLFIYSAVVGIVLAVFQWVNNYALTIVDGTFLFPAYSGGSIILSLLSGVFLFKDKLNKKQILGVSLGVMAVVLMNF